MASSLSFGGYGQEILGVYSTSGQEEAIHARSSLVHQAVRLALAKVACRPREVLVCSVCQENIADAAREVFEQHATDSIRRVTFEPTRKK